MARIVAVLVLVVVAAWSFVDGRPPAPQPADAPPTAVSAERAATTVEQLATEPRPIGSPASGRVRDELARRLGELGLSTRVQSSAGTFTGDGMVGAGRVENLVATLPGTAPTGSVVLAAHADSVARGPGASDDMSSVAAILEAVRALRAGPPLRNDLIVLITDGEESGLYGAQAWVHDELAPGRRPTVTLNFEARGTSGPSLMFQTSPGDAGLVRAFTTAVAHPIGDSSLVEAYKLLPNDTDLSTVLDAGRPGLNSAFVEQPINYHTAQDSPANLGRDSLQAHAETALGLARALGDQDLAPLDPAVSGAPRQDDLTYFRFLGAVVTYPQERVGPVAGLAALMVLAAAVVGRVRRRVGLGGVFVAAVTAVLAVAVGVAAAIGLWELLTLVRPSYADTGPFLGRPVLFQLADVALALGVVAVWYLPLRRRVGPLGAATGAALVLAVLGVVTAALLPGVSFLLAVPALGLGVGLVVAVLLRPGGAAAAPVVALGAIPAVVLLVPLAWSLFVLSGVSDGVPVAVALLAAAPLVAVLDRHGGPGRWGLVVTALVAVAGLAGAGLLVDRPTPERPQSTRLAYVADADAGTARWVSDDDAPVPWTARYVPEPAAIVPAWIGDDPVRSGPATPTGAPAPTATVVERGPDRVVLQVTSPRRAPSIVLRPDRPLAGATVSFPGRPTVSSSGSGPLRQVRLDGVGPEGARVELRPVGPGPLGVAVADLSTGLDGLPGFVARPPELRGSANRSSDQVVVSRRVTS